MSGLGPEPAEILRLALEAISDRDADRLAALLAPDVTVRTGRASHEGADAVRAWARKGYDHLDRRYVLEAIDEVGA
jgi:ketosteroid isomerase-like protein